jgi:hypothetical protein
MRTVFMNSEVQVMPQQIDITNTDERIIRRPIFIRPPFLRPFFGDLLFSGDLHFFGDPILETPF